MGKVLGIIAEYNPLHNGHIYHLNQAKRITNADATIVAMSGAFTQAGNIGIIDKFDRASIALMHGADLVIEIPQIYVLSSANYFAYGAVNLLNSMKIVDNICFGSECNDINTIKSIAKKTISYDDNIWKNIRNMEQKNISFASIRQNYFKNILTDSELSILKSSNDILGIEYVKSLINLNSSIKPFTIKRNNHFSSSTKIRHTLKNNGSISNLVPQGILSILNDNYILNDEMYKIIRYTILNSNKDLLSNIKGISEGLESKLINEFKVSRSYDEFINKIKSKRYQMSKIKRILINLILNITKDDFNYALENNISYCHVLAANDVGKKLLSRISKSANIEIITSINDKKINNLPSDIKKYLEFDIKSENIYSILSNKYINKDYTNKL